MTLPFSGAGLAGATVLLGLLLLGYRLGRRRPANAIRRLHLAFAAGALSVLYAAAIAWSGTRSLPFDAGTLVLTLTLAGGGLLLALRLSRLPRPLFVIIVHGAAAMLGFALLIVGLVRG